MKKDKNEKVDFSNLSLSEFTTLKDVPEEVLMPKEIKAWEKAFDQEWCKPSNVITEIVDHVSAWCCYAPPSRRKIIADKILAEAKDAKSLYICLIDKEDWDDVNKKRLEKEWERASQAFIDCQEQQYSNLIDLANSAYFLAPEYSTLAKKMVSTSVINEANNENVRKHYLGIRAPGDLSDDACARFLEIASDKVEIDSIISKLSLAMAVGGKAGFNALHQNNEKHLRAKTLWEKVSLKKILKTKNLAEAFKVIDDFAPKNILINMQACRHLCKLLDALEPPVLSLFEKQPQQIVWQQEAYELGKKVYRKIIDLHGKDSLIAAAVMTIWGPYLINQISIKHTPDDELESIFKIITGNAKDVISYTYYQRLKKQFDTDMIV